MYDLGNIIQSQCTLWATLLLPVKKLCSKFQTTALTTSRLPVAAAKPLSLRPQPTTPPRQVAGDPVPSHSTQPILLDPADNMRLRTVEPPLRLTSTILTRADIQDAAVPQLLTNSEQLRPQSSSRSFSPSSSHVKQLRRMTRYYASALKPDEKVVLSRGDQNHNLKRWTEVDLILHKGGLKDLAPKDVYIGPDEQVCIIPVIIVTDGEKARTHKQQVFHKFHRLRISSEPAMKQATDGPIARERAYFVEASRVARLSSHTANYHQPQPVSYQSPPPSTASFRARSPLVHEVGRYRPRKEVTFDSILAPQQSSKVEMYRNEQPGFFQRAKKTLGI